MFVNPNGIKMLILLFFKVLKRIIKNTFKIDSIMRHFKINVIRF